jgi:preprotein translocase subunit YajC
MTQPVFAIFLQQAGGAGLIGFLPIVLIFIIFYVLIMLPQQKRQKKWQAMVNSVKAGDKVTTAGGIRGTVLSVKDDAVQIRVAPDNLRLEIARGAITGVGGDEQKAS